MKYKKDVESMTLALFYWFIYERQAVTAIFNFFKP